MLYSYWSRRAISLGLVPCLLLIASRCTGDPQAKQSAHMQKGEASVAQEKYTEAIIEFRNTIKVDPQDVQVYDKLALALPCTAGTLNQST